MQATETIKCFNGEKVYVAFALDCHDREALSNNGSNTLMLKLRVVS